jgi:transposase
VEVLRRIWVQQFYREEGRVLWREEKDLPPAAQRINSPYDPDARHGTKGDMTWIDYKAHLTETCDPELPHLITQVETTLATGTDYEALPRVQEELARRDLLPAAHLVDGGYVAAENLVTSQQRAIALVGPVPEDSHWQARAGQGFDAAHIVVDWEAQRVTCPRGQTSVKWQATYDPDHQPVVRVRFGHRACLACASRPFCTRAKMRPRQLLLRPHARRDALCAARQRQKTAACKDRYAARAGIEGTMAQGVRSCGLRRARYSGGARTDLQHVLTAVARTVVRLSWWLSGQRPARTTPAPFAALFVAASR